MLASVFDDEGQADMHMLSDQQAVASPLSSGPPA
jgi:hypothetical protein